MWSSDHLKNENAKPTLSLQCPSPNQVISELQFVSFGNPHGTCGSFVHGRCRSKRARRIVHRVGPCIFPWFSILLYHKICSRRDTFCSLEIATLLQACMGKAKCSFEVSVSTFDEPCANVTKSLAVEASCSWVVPGFRIWSKHLSSSWWWKFSFLAPSEAVTYTGNVEAVLEELFGVVRNPRWVRLWRE